MRVDEPIAPVQPHEIAREIVHAVSPYGDKLQLPVRSTGEAPASALVRRRKHSTRGADATVMHAV